MIFSSIDFIFLFAPLFFLTYFILPDRFRNTVLFIGSLLFYLFGMPDKPEYIGILCLSVFFNYGYGRLLSMHRGKLWLALGIGVNVLSLCYFKYCIGEPPVGMSFFTFQAISYPSDIYRKKYPEERSFVEFGTYLTMFPKLISGPLLSYGSIKQSLESRQSRLHDVVQGLQTFILGLGSKVILADQVGGLWRQISSIGYESISTPLAWMGLYAFGVQIYFDFLGYSMMAIGLGRMMGFELPKNFDYPYLSVSVTEFWRHWHITLGSWFREYVYIPLGGNRKGRVWTYFNLFVVWILTGAWHGASYNFLLWGLFLFVLIAVEKAGWKLVLDKHRIVGHIYLVAAIFSSWTIFAIPKWTDFTCFWGRLMGRTSEWQIFAGDYIKYGKKYGIFMVLCLLFITRLPERLWKKVRETYLGMFFLLGIFLSSVYFLYNGVDNPFMYSQF